MSTDGVLGAVYLPTDGWLDPSGPGPRAGRRRAGPGRPDPDPHPGRRDRCGARSSDRRDRRAQGRTRQEIRADVVVNAGGMFAPEIGRMAGVNVPIIPMAHQYLFTEPIEGVHPGLPQLRDPDNLVYFREEVGGLCMGGYERDPAPWALDGIPADFNGKLLAPDWPRFEPIMEAPSGASRPWRTAGVNRMINGPEAFTPDNEFILGESEVRGFFVAAGFSAHGIAGAGGIGRQMATWIVDGEPELDLWKMDIRRFGAALPIAGVHAGALDRELRHLLRHPLPERGAPGRPPAADLADVRDPDRPRRVVRREVRLGASELVRVECRRRRRVAPPARLGRNTGRPRSAPRRSPRARAAGLFDETSFAKLEVSGTGATAFLQRLCANDVDRPVGSIVYTQLLNRRGGIECDLTVTRLAPTSATCW